MTSYHHLDSTYARLMPSAIDFVIETVRDANEVLHESDAIDARTMIVCARSVFETERAFELDPEAFVQTDRPVRSDWTLACAAEALSSAVRTLRERGSAAAAQRARADWLSVLRRLADSPDRSPMIDYGGVLRDLVEHIEPDRRRDKLELQIRYLAEDVNERSCANVRWGLCDIAESHLLLGQTEIAFHILCELVRYDPTSIEAHHRVALILVRSHAPIALAAAERALLLLPREDVHDRRGQLRRLIADARSRTATADSASARELLAELRKKPGKRARSSLRTLASSLVPAIEWLPKKRAEPLPTAAELAQLRRDLHTLPRPLPSHAAPHRAPEPTGKPAGLAVPGHISAPVPMATAVQGATARQPKPGRNDPCPCGSGKKSKRCCGSR